MRVVVVDDQEIERFHMKVLFKHCPDVEVVGEAGNISDAAELINREQPDAIFLDIDLGQGVLGFDLLREIETNAKIVFVTLYNEFAVRAFRVNALDYIMKPVTIERLSETMVRLNQQADKEPEPEQHIVEKNDFIHLKEGGRQALVPIDHICVIEADGDYTHIYTLETGVFFMRRPMKDWLSMLPTDLFAGLDRKLTISMQRMREIRAENNKSGVISIWGVDQEFVLGKTALKEARRIMKYKGLQKPS